MTVAARATAERKTFGHLSYRVATRRQNDSAVGIYSHAINMRTSIAKLEQYHSDVIPGDRASQLRDNDEWA